MAMARGKARAQSRPSGAALIKSFQKIWLRNPEMNQNGDDRMHLHICLGKNAEGDLLLLPMSHSPSTPKPWGLGAMQMEWEAHKSMAFCAIEKIRFWKASEIEALGFSQSGQLSDKQIDECFEALQFDHRNLMEALPKLRFRKAAEIIRGIAHAAGCMGELA